MRVRVEAMERVGGWVMERLLVIVERDGGETERMEILGRDRETTDGYTRTHANSRTGC